MKKKVLPACIAGAAAVALALCLANAKPTEREPGALRIVATIFPEYDWTRNILGDRADGTELTLLLGNGVDLHSYQPTAKDILAISTADLFIYVGGESDEWVAGALRGTMNKTQRTVNLLEALGDAAKEEETVEGMETGSEEDDEAEYDEHVWLSLRNAQVLCTAIAQELCALAPAHADEYRRNLAAYAAQLSALDGEYQTVVSQAARRTLVFGDRFPFRYLTDDYGLSYYAAFAGCSAETEASFRTVVFLAQKLDELDGAPVCTIEQSDQKLARTIIQASAAKTADVLTMDSMQSVTVRDVMDGATYLGIMRGNLAVLRAALYER